MSNFDDIRAYQDHEVSSVLTSLLNDGDFLSFIAQQAHPKLHQFLPFLVKKNLQKKLKKQFEGINDVANWQKTIAPFVQSIIDQTINTFSVKGIENLEKDKTYLFMSNHRDIAMDPMLVNYALLSSGFATSKVAIGDNLLGRPFVAKLMRLNKSFVVKRSISARREKLEAVQTLSSYVHESIKQNHSIWIAQKEGRAKDNCDKTDTAVLKMLHLAGRKLGWEFKDSMKFLNIVPVSISYEWDPCDIDKANEITMVEKNKVYEKTKDEDFQTIIKGLKGHKGNVTIEFSAPLNLESNQAEDWANKIDEQIYNGYEIFENNVLAHELLTEDATSNSPIFDQWSQRFSDVLKHDSYSQLIKNYTEPVRKKIQ